MKRLLALALTSVFVIGAFALLAPSSIAGGPKPCPLIGCGPCAQLKKIPGEKCPVCVAIPGCTP